MRKVFGVLLLVYFIYGLTRPMAPIKNPKKDYELFITNLESNEEFYFLRDKADIICKEYSTCYHDILSIGQVKDPILQKGKIKRFLMKKFPSTNIKVTLVARQLDPFKYVKNNFNINFYWYGEDLLFDGLNFYE